MLERAKIALSILKIKIMKSKMYLLPAIIATILGVLIIALRPTKTKAEQIEPIPMNKINFGFDKFYQFFKTSVDPESYSFDRTYIDYRTAAAGSIYAYEIISLGSDNPNINSVFVSMITNATQANNFIYRDYYSGNDPAAIECGFYRGNSINSNAQALDNLFLPYYIPRSYFINTNQNSGIVTYINLEQPVVAEGDVYFIVRYRETYRLSFGIGTGRPEVMLWDLNITQGQITAGYTLEDLQAAQNEAVARAEPNIWGAGYDLGFEEGKIEGYNQAINAPDNERYRAGFNAGVKSNSIKIGNTITTIFSGLTEFLNIEIFGGITLGGIMLIPLMFGILWVVLKIIRG